MMIEKLNIYLILFLFASVQGLLLSVYLLIKNLKSNQHNIFLAAFIFVFSLMIFDNIIYWTKSYEEFHYFINLSRPFIFLFGPLLYFFQLRRSNIKWAKFFFHAIPFLIHFLVKLPFYLLGADEKVIFMMTAKEQSWIYYLYPILSSISLLGYNILIYKQYDYESVSENKLDTITFYAFSIHTITYLLYYILVYTISFKVEYDYALSFISSSMIYFVAYYSFLSPEQKEKKKYERSLLKEHDAKNLAQKLETIMINQKPFLNSELRLTDLASKLDVTVNHLSQLINSYFGKSFADYINRYRVDEAKKIIKNKLNLTLLAIAYDSGFNNKTSFNHYFKKNTGISPSEFRKQLSRE